MSIDRLLAPLKIWRLLIKLKPEVIIVTCAELLMVSIANKILFGSKVIYDVQENYYLNIRYAHTYPAMLSLPLALLTRAMESICSRWIDGFILAESIYADQLRFYNSNTIVLENKALIPKNEWVPPTKQTQQLQLVYAGTIAAHYGVFDAIRLVQWLHAHQVQVNLTIAGFAAQKHVLAKLQQMTRGVDYIRIIGGDTLVSHHQILEKMKFADFCLLPYQYNKSTTGRIPTKLYECLAMEIPVIISLNDAWDNLIIENNAGIRYDFETSKEFDLAQLDRRFYGHNRHKEYLWDSTSDQLVLMIDQMAK
ncbi:MAG: glycosyltransferase family 4 protein [Cyclobacteriaceae bacterium]|nr:glycosyltransferase family 4 protein [Cyclobacteriaceae bacterium]